MKLQLILAWRYLNGRKLRSFLTTLAVIFGVMIIFGMNIILPTMIQAFQANMTAIAGVVDVTVTRQTGSVFPAGEADKLIGIPGVRAVSAVLDRTINLPVDFVDRNPSRADRVTALDLLGVNPGSAQALHIYLIQNSGRFLQARDTNAAVITQSLADAFGVGLGGTIRVPSVNGVTELTVVGLLPARTVPGNEQVLVPLNEAQAITGQMGMVNTIEVDLSGTDLTVRSKTTSAVQAALGSGYQVGSAENDSQLFASIKLGQAAFNMFGVLALFMGGFIIFNTFRTLVVERRRDIGMLRALGASGHTITGMILAEGLLQGLVGSAIGLLLGYLFGSGLILVIQRPLNTFIHVSLGKPIVAPTLVVTSILLGVGITVLSGLIPSVNASRVTPMDALRPSMAENEYKRSTGPSFIVGLILIGLALLALTVGNFSLIAVGGVIFLVGLILVAPALLRPIAFVFGRLTAFIYARQGTGDLAQGNLTRQPARVAVTASATMIGLAIVVALGGMTSSLSGMMQKTLLQSLGSDYLLVPPSISVWTNDLGAGPSLAERLKSIPEVSQVSTLRFASSLIGSQAINVLGIDPLVYPEVSGLDFKQGNESAYTALANGRNMIVNAAFLAAVNARVGDELQLTTPTGSRTYRIVANATDLLNAKVVTAYISQANLSTDFGVREDVFLQMDLKPGADAAAADRQVKAVAADFPQFKVIAGKSYIKQMIGLLSAVFAGMYILLAFLALPSLIAMLNTLTISVLERRREIGMIRAVGGTRQQVRRIVVAEALLLSAVGTAFGILSGLYLGFVIVRGLGVLFPLTYSFPFAGVVAGILIGLFFGALAAIIPARQAARLQVVEALRYE